MKSAKIVSVDTLRFESDGPGICTIVHTYGCNLACKWCSNPQTWYGDKYKIISVGELFEIVSPHNLYYQSTGGGITFSGGEPLLWSDYIIEFSELCKENNWKLNVETACNLQREIINNTFGNIDNYLIDIKHMDDEYHIKYTGVSNELILENISFISNNIGSDKIQIAIPLIPGVNDDDNNIYKTAEFISSLGIKRVKIIPYRKTGLEKAKILGITQDEYKVNSSDNLQRVKDIINLYL